MVEKMLSGYPPCEQNPMVSQAKTHGKKKACMTWNLPPESHPRRSMAILHPPLLLPPHGASAADLRQIVLLP